MAIAKQKPEDVIRDHFVNTAINAIYGEFAQSQGLLRCKHHISVIDLNKIAVEVVDVLSKKLSK